MMPARIAHCPTLMMSSAGRPSRFAWRWATQRPTTIEVAMRMPYQRTGNGPNPKIAGIWNAMAPGDANMTHYDKPWEAVSPRNAGVRNVVGAAGFEPARPRGQRILSPRRLPLRHAPVVRIVSRDLGSRSVRSGHRARTGIRGGARSPATRTRGAVKGDSHGRTTRTRRHSRYRLAGSRSPGDRPRSPGGRLRGDL